MQNIQAITIRKENAVQTMDREMQELEREMSAFLVHSHEIFGTSDNTEGQGQGQAGSTSDDDRKRPATEGLLVQDWENAVLKTQMQKLDREMSAFLHSQEILGFADKNTKGHAGRSTSDDVGRRPRKVSEDVDTNMDVEMHMEMDLEMEMGMGDSESANREEVETVLVGKSESSQSHGDDGSSGYVYDQQENIFRYVD